MIFITGDIHGDIDIGKLNNKNFPQGKKLTKDDYLIICGDFGLIWTGDKRDDWWLNWLESKPWTTIFVCGNHENFDAIYKYPIKDWKGGKVHEIRPSIFHLMRGEIFTIENKTFFSMGGAKSSDKEYRKEFISWWSQEEPNEKELSYGLSNLEKYSNKIDYIISHTCPAKLIQVFDYLDFSRNKLSNINYYFDNIAENIVFDTWFFGHYHDDRSLGKYQMLYDKILKLN